MYHTDLLNVDVKLPLTVEFDKIDGVTKALQLFPDEEDLADMYIVYIEDGKFEQVKTALEAHPGVELVEEVPMRKLIQ